MANGRGIYLGIWLLATLLLGLATGPMTRGQEQSVLSADEIIARERQAGNDPAKLLELANQVGPRDARRLLQKAVKQLTAEKNTRTDREELALHVAKILARAAQSPEEVTAILGAQASKQIARQVFYRRYREQWIYEVPLRLYVVFDAPKGQEPRVLTVRPLPATVP